ncbi:restriction endonuclease [Alcaligenes faecalis]|uniref:restriction endonuclease n=1 Tax=Alcaligenes faecalis TaxID=511 RepID=UPI000F67A65D|nr:restriction endonuclease [Alcaligenes faecalis]MBQ0216414.1 restriction endonuclease [Alcaligenes faecalis]RSE62705.1 restriction endonuclease [Alcaligenes faecalis]
MAADWFNYQEEAAAFFRDLGLDAQTNVTVQGVRTQHDIDVLVKMHHVGFDVTWVIECKHWKSKVSKLHVAGLRTIVQEIGADRGILLCEAGFQSGAIEAAQLTNIVVTSLANVMQSAQNDVYNLRIRELLERIESAKDRYWNIPKGVRTEHGLRQEVGDVGYSAFLVLHTANEIMGKAIRGIYPITEVTPFELTITKSPPVFSSPQEVLAYLEPIIVDLENRLASCEKAYDRGGVHATDVQ